MTPEVVDDLKGIYDIYGEADNWFLTYDNGNYLRPSEWDNVKRACKDFCPGYVSLKEAISAWAIKFNLVGESDFYQSLGLVSLSFFYSDCKESEREKRMKPYREIAKRYNVSLEAVRRSDRYNKTWPYEEKLTLADNVFKDDESDDIELSKSIGLGEDNYNSFFEATFPFAFSPNTLHILNFLEEKSIDMYEEIKTYNDFILSLFNQNKETLLKYEESLLPYRGIAWDPRAETWRDFEEAIDKMYENYKVLYRERAEKFLLNRGYLKEREKKT